ncbi:MAG: hypothetical protein Kow0029_07770 [Candidatus Rifleibacteriota bacterium]
MKKNAYCFLLIFLLMLSAHASAEDTGKLITNKCRANLKMLNEAVKKFVAENDSSLPAWSTYKNVKDMLLEIKYLPHDPVPPTKDCKYYLVAPSRHDFQWYCDIHGMLEGDKTITFNYHEHKITAKTNSRYLNIKKYADHTKDLLRWTEYNPTPMEKLKYHYNKNPMTTILLLIFGVLVIFFIYKNVFQ